MAVLTERGSGRQSLWRFRYRHGGVEKLLTLGAYPDVLLKRAREKRDDARRYVADGVDPSAKRRAERDASTNTFVAVADEWLLTKKNALTPATWQRDHDQLHKWVVPYLCNRPIASIEAPELLEVLKRIEAQGVIDTAHRTREVCGRVFRYAIVTGRAKRDIAADLRGALAFARCDASAKFRLPSADPHWDETRKTSLRIRPIGAQENPSLSNSRI